MKKFFKILMLLVLVSSTITAQVPAATIPEFKFSRYNETVFANKDLPPGKMIFFIFFDPGCDHCQRAITYLNQHVSEFRKAAIYLITIDVKEKTDRFFATYGNSLKKQKNITVLRDFQNDFISKFRPRKYPSLFLYSPQKKLILYDDEEKNMVKFLSYVKGKA
ncbi:MAG: hypothetical protein JWP81_3075 [Ferruginibacter sp.]|nr:hypothetical protein [Ferruginibacter sp.]